MFYTHEFICSGGREQKKNRREESTTQLYMPPKQSIQGGSRIISPNPLVHEHIPPSLLPNIATYKYSGVDKSILSNYLMCYYWTFLVELLPMWVAPNVVTLTGFVISLSSTALILGFDIFDRLLFGGSLRGDVPVGEYPSWVWMYAAAALFAYQTLDALDGKQARRTKSGSPMGELFDHGCDAFITPLVQINICVALGLVAGSLQQFVFFVVVTSGLLFAIWEQYVTGTLDFGYITGPTEGILITCGLFILTGQHGIAFWQTASLPGWMVVNRTVVPSHIIPGLSGIPLMNAPLHVSIATWGTALYAFVLLAAVLTVLTNILHVAVRPRVNTHPVGIAVTSILPNALVLGLFAVFFQMFPAVSAKAPFLLEVCFGFFASYTATRLTVSRLCVMNYRPLSGFFLSTLLCVGGPVVAQFSGVVDLNVPAAHEGMIYLLTALLVFGVVYYLHLIVSVFRQLSVFLRIDIFKIKKLEKSK